LYRQYFPNSAAANPYVLFQWLPLPEHINGYDFEELANKNGVEILCAERFLVGGAEQSALRVATCSPDTTEELEQGLKLLKKLLPLV
jgi:uncharacterized HTH-type transcriptional regulator ydeF